MLKALLMFGVCLAVLAAGTWTGYTPGLVIRVCAAFLLGGFFWQLCISDAKSVTWEIGHLSIKSVNYERMHATEELAANDHDNYTLRGSGIDRFVECLTYLRERRLVRACVMDKYGDWLISTEDDTPAAVVLATLDQFELRDDVDVVRYGELTTTLESVEEYKEVMELPGLILPVAGEAAVQS